MEFDFTLTALSPFMLENNFCHYEQGDDHITTEIEVNDLSFLQLLSCIHQSVPFRNKRAVCILLNVQQKCDVYVIQCRFSRAFSKRSDVHIYLRSHFDIYDLRVSW